MKLTKKPQLMLFALYQFYKEANKRLKPKPLTAVLPKTEFIRLVRKSGIAQKQPRAIYKNLEVLEKKKLIKYDAKELKFTQRGLKLVKEIEKDVKPYLQIKNILKQEGTQKIIKKYQTIFK